MVTASAPLAKRTALSVLSLRATCLSFLTLNVVARLDGDWVSGTLCRRIDRRIAQESVHPAVPALLAYSEFVSEVSDIACASEPSSLKGVFVATYSSKEVVMALWRAGDERGGYAKLLNPFSACLAERGEECEGEAYAGAGVDPSFDGPIEFPLMKRPCGFEQPRLLKMAWTEFWFSLHGDSSSGSASASCQFGSSRRGEFRFLFYLVDAAPLETMCLGGHSHVKIERKYTKDSEVYVEALRRHLAVGICYVLRPRFLEAENEVSVVGLGSSVANDLHVSASWELGKVCGWRRPHHISMQEVGAIVSAIEDATLYHDDCGPCFLVDSEVAQGTLAKGRGSAFNLQPSLKRPCAIQLAFGMLPYWEVAPTRSDVAGDPTHDAEVRFPWSSRWIVLLGASELAVEQVSGSKRFAASWVWLVTLLVLPQPFHVAFVESGKTVLWSDWIPLWTLSWTLSDRCGFSISVMILLAPLSVFGILLGISCGFRSRWTVSSCLDSKRTFFRGTFWGISLVVAALTVGRANAAMEPASAAGQQRAEVRNHNFLPADRVERKETRARRLQSLDRFRVWLWTERKVSLRRLLAQKLPDPEQITGLLVEYGREMYVAGKTYGQFSDNIDAFTMVEPLEKGQLTAVWDLCFAWSADEPFHHHPAMPALALLALVSVALMWGWVQVGGVLGLAWAGILKIGEVLQAQRSNLVLPGDGAPKALRKRFQFLLKALTIPVENSSGVRPFDLGSLRLGGASLLLNKTENSEIDRRRGRWISHMVMEVYLQEIQVAALLQKLTPSQRQKILDLLEDLLTSWLLLKTIWKFHFCDDLVLPDASTASWSGILWGVMVQWPDIKRCLDQSCNFLAWHERKWEFSLNVS